jgi:hypothetical protein
MAELLVKASGHWMDKLTQADVDKMDESELRSYKARSQKGDVVVVRPDGWPWGKEECLPNFIVVKVPDMTDAEAKAYESPLTETVIEKDKDGKDVETARMVRFRKHAMPKADIDTQVSIETTAVSLAKANLVSKIITKTGAASEITAPVIKEI